MADTVDVHDFRHHRGWCPRGRPAGRRRLDIAPDNGAFPVWTWGTLPAVAGRPAGEAHGCATPRFLGISTDLAAELLAWADWQDRHGQMRGPFGTAETTTDEQWEVWQARGRVLAHRLAEETGDEVVYLWPSEGRDEDCPHCGPSASG